MFGKILRQLLLLLLIALIGVGFYGYNCYQTTLSTPLGKDTVISIAKGSNINTLAKQLETIGMKHAWALILYARLNDDATKIKAGDYRITATTTPTALLDDITNGKVIVLQFRFIEGKNAKDLLAQLADEKDLKHELTGKTQIEIAQILGLPNDSLEGQFLPDTYHYHYGNSDLDLLKRMHTALKTTLDSAWNSRTADLALKTPYDALILASIIEKETGIASERNQVSGVFNRRLKKGMRLQTDPSVIYGILDYQPPLTRKMLQTDTPYNTYTRNGLPPTPIAMPSAASIYAAVQPDTGDSLYFVANGTGGHTFSATYAEHQKAVQHLRQLEQQK